MISFEKKEINITQNIAKYKIFTIVKEKFCLEESENRTDSQRYIRLRKESRRAI